MLEHAEAVEYELIRFGLRSRMLGNGRLTWGDVRVIVSNPPLDSPLRRAFSDNHEWPWTRTDHLLALVVDVLQLANWQRGGGKGSKPKPIPRPGSREVETRRFGAQPIPLAKFDAWWNGEMDEEEVDGRG